MKEVSSFRVRKNSLYDKKANTSWIGDKLKEMKKVLDQDSPPNIESTCEKCAYLKGGKNYF